MKLTIFSEELSSYLSTIGSTEIALDDTLELSCYHVLAKRRHTVNKHCTLQMVEFMLHHASQISPYPLIMFIKILIHILYMDACRTNHLLIDTRNRKTSLFRRVGIFLIAL